MSKQKGTKPETNENDRTLTESQVQAEGVTDTPPSPQTQPDVTDRRPLKPGEQPQGVQPTSGEVQDPPLPPAQGMDPNRERDQVSQQTADEQLAAAGVIKHPLMRNEEVHTRLGVLRLNGEGCVENLEELLGEDGDKDAALKYLKEVGFINLDPRIPRASNLEGVLEGEITEPPSAVRERIFMAAGNTIVHGSAANKFEVVGQSGEQMEAVKL